MENPSGIYTDLEINVGNRQEAGVYDIDLRLDVQERELQTRESGRLSLDPYLLQQPAGDISNYGARLTNAVFHDENIRAVFHQAITYTEALNAVLRIHLAISESSPELHAVSWELLQNSVSGLPISTDPNVLFSRFIFPKNLRPRPVRSEAEVKNFGALAVVSNPNDLSVYQFTPIDVEMEFDLFSKALGEIPLVRLPSNGLKATLKNIKSQLNKRPFSIMILYAHCAQNKGESFYWLVNDQGETLRAGVGDIASIFFNNQLINPELVILAGSYGDAAIRLVEAGVPSVICLFPLITISDANSFLVSFLEEVTQTGQIDQAMSIARTSLYKQQYYWQPVLYSSRKIRRLWGDSLKTTPTPGASLDSSSAKGAPSTVVRSKASKVQRLSSAEGTPTSSFDARSGVLSGISLSGDGHTAALACADSTLKIFEIPSGTLLRSLQGHSSALNGVAMDAVLPLAVTASADNNLIVWDIKEGGQRFQLIGHTGEANAVAMTPGGDFAISASSDRTLKLWDLRYGKELQTYSGHTGGVLCAAFSPGGKTAISGGRDSDLRLWPEIGRNELWHVLKGHTYWVRSVAFAGTRVISASDDHTLKVWDMDSGQELATLTGHTRGVTAVVVNNDNRLAVSASSDKTLKVWNLATYQEIATLEGHESWVLGLAASIDFRTLASCDYDGLVKTWDLSEIIASLPSIDGLPGSLSTVKETTSKPAIQAAQRKQAVSKGQLSSSKVPPPPPPLTVYPEVRIIARSEPNLSAPIIGAFEKNEPLSVIVPEPGAARAMLGSAGAWIQVEGNKGRRGYTSARYLGLEFTPAEPDRSARIWIVVGTVKGKTASFDWDEQFGSLERGEPKHIAWTHVTRNPGHANLAESRPGDPVLAYVSGRGEPYLAGLGRIASEPYESGDHLGVDIVLVQRFKNKVTREDIKLAAPESQIIKYAQPSFAEVTPHEWIKIRAWIVMRNPDLTDMLPPAAVPERFDLDIIIAGVESEEKVGKVVYLLKGSFRNTGNQVLTGAEESVFRLDWYDPNIPEQRQFANAYKFNLVDPLPPGLRVSSSLEITDLPSPGRYQVKVTLSVPNRKFTSEPFMIEEVTIEAQSTSRLTIAEIEGQESAIALDAYAFDLLVSDDSDDPIPEGITFGVQAHWKTTSTATANQPIGYAELPQLPLQNWSYKNTTRQLNTPDVRVGSAWGPFTIPSPGEPGDFDLEIEIWHADQGLVSQPRSKLVNVQVEPNTLPFYRHEYEIMTRAIQADERFPAGSRRLMNRYLPPIEKAVEQGNLKTASSKHKTAVKFWALWQENRAAYIEAIDRLARINGGYTKFTYQRETALQLLQDLIDELGLLEGINVLLTKETEILDLLKQADSQANALVSQVSALDQAEAARLQAEYQSELTRLAGEEDPRQGLNNFLASLLEEQGRVERRAQLLSAEVGIQLETEFPLTIQASLPDPAFPAVFVPERVGLRLINSGQTPWPLSTPFSIWQTWTSKSDEPSPPKWFEFTDLLSRREFGRSSKDIDGKLILHPPGAGPFEVTLQALLPDLDLRSEPVVFTTEVQYQDTVAQKSSETKRENNEQNLEAMMAYRYLLDEIVQAAAIDERLPHGARDRINQAASETEQAIGQDDRLKAGDALEALKKLWNSWSSHRTERIAQLDRIALLDQRIAKLTAVQRNSLQDERKKLENKINALVGVSSSYVSIEKSLTPLEKKVATLENEIAAGVESAKTEETTPDKVQVDSGAAAIGQGATAVGQGGISVGGSVGGDVIGPRTNITIGGININTEVYNKYNDFIGREPPQHKITITITPQTIELTYDKDYLSPAGPLLNDIDLKDPFRFKPVEYGQRLFKHLISTERFDDHEPTYDGYKAARNASKDGRLEIAIETRSMTPELGIFLWEYLTDVQGDPLATLVSSPFYRQVGGDSGHIPPDAKPLKILFAISSPLELNPIAAVGQGGSASGSLGLPAPAAQPILSVPGRLLPENPIRGTVRQLVQLNRAAEAAAIQDGMQEAAAHSLATYEIIGGPGDLSGVTWERIQQKVINEKFHVLHLLAHGIQNPLTGAFNLVMETADHHFSLVGIDRVDQQIADNSDLRLVMLASCRSADPTASLYKDNRTGAQSFAERLLEIGIPAVIAMQENMDIAAAQLLTRSFYDDLARLGRIDTALASARHDLYAWQKENRAWGVPVLLLKGGNPHLFTVDANLAVEQDYKRPSPEEKISELKSYQERTGNPDPIKSNTMQAAESLFNAAGFGGKPALMFALQQTLASQLPVKPEAAIPLAEPQATRALADKYCYPLAISAYDLKNYVSKVHKDQLELPPDTYGHIAGSLNAGKHIILTGPPGSAKTSLAMAICDFVSRYRAQEKIDSTGVVVKDAGGESIYEARTVNPNEQFTPGYHMATATSDWTTFDTVGGYMPDSSGALQFRLGAFLDAIRKGEWLVIDEINRAEIDKAFGPLFTVLSGQRVELPYRVGKEIVCVRPADLDEIEFWGENNKDVWVPQGVTDSDFTYVIHPNWRIIGTMNVYDKSSLFQMSLAFMRRFAFIDVELPDDTKYTKIIDRWWNKYIIDSDRAATAANPPEDIRPLLREMLWQKDNPGHVKAPGDQVLMQNNPLMKRRAIGPAIVRDMMRYVGDRYGNLGPNEKAAARMISFLAEAFALYVTPQLDGLDYNGIRNVYLHLETRLFKNLDAGDRESIMKRVRTLYPHIAKWERPAEEDE